MPDMKFNCVGCGAEIHADAAMIGRIVQCPGCRHAVKVPRDLVRKGTVLGDYVLERLLGRGGMGEVWLATQSSVGRKVALKILSPALSGNEEFTARFLNEIKMTAKLDHPGIVSAYEAGCDGGFYFLATSYVEGVTLEAKIAETKGLREKEALEIARKVAEALRYAWERHRMLHRDVKPSNIMLDKAGGVKLMDMGISKSVKDRSSITITGAILGTPSYMSPEQARGEKELDCRTDIYSLGASLYHMLTGKLPYGETNAMATFARVLLDQATSIRKFNPRISPACESLVKRMMAKDKARRHRDWQELLAELGGLLDGGIPLPIQEKIDSLKERSAVRARRSKTFWISVAVAALFIVLLLVLVSTRRARASAAEGDSIEVVEIGHGLPDLDGMEKDLKVGRLAPPAESVAQVKSLDSEPKKSGPTPATAAEEPGKSSGNGEPQGKVAGPLETDSVKRHPEFAGNIIHRHLSEKLGFTEEEIKSSAPVILAYLKELKKLKDEKPSGGRKLGEIKKRLDQIAADTQKKAEAVLDKDKAEKLVQFLEDKRKQLSRPGMMRGGSAKPGR